MELKRSTQINRRVFLKFSAQAMIGMAMLDNRKLQSKPVKDQDISLDEKIGQMLMVGFRGLHVSKSHPIAQDILRRHIGGVVLFDYDVPNKSPVRNIQSPTQLKTLVRSLQELSPTPFIIAIDYEGGRITRLKEKFGFPPTLSAQTLGAKKNLTFTRKQSLKMARQLSELGINLNLAPVVDLNTNPENPIIGKLERSFSADPNIVSRHASVFIESHHTNGILCTLKHFPGHGSSADDSHLGLVDVTDTWSFAELEPYARLIQMGMVDAIMTAHVFNKRLDPKYPATLSKSTITDLLRKKMNYDGVMISDDMQMGAIASEYGLETAIQRAIEAGVDVLAFANNSVFEEDIATRAVQIVKKLIKSGKIRKSRIDASYRRILKLKSRL